MEAGNKTTIQISRGRQAQEKSHSRKFEQRRPSNVDRGNTQAATNILRRRPKREQANVDMAAVKFVLDSLSMPRVCLRMSMLPKVQGFLARGDFAIADMVQGITGIYRMDREWLETGQ